MKEINLGDPEEAWSLLADEQFSDISFIQFRNYQTLLELLSERIAHQFSNVRSAQSPEKMLEEYRKFKILGAHRRGPRGVETINQGLEQILQKKNLLFLRQGWYEGRPVIINTNDYSLGLSNGDMGVCIKTDEGDQAVFFNKGEGSLVLPHSRLPAHNTAFALTVHKSQGSEFDEIILVVLPDTNSRLLYRELLYTAVSRAKKKITLIGSEQAFKKAIIQRFKHHSGLKNYLWKSM